MCSNREYRGAMCGFEGKYTKTPLKREKVPFTYFKIKNETSELNILKMKMYFLLKSKFFSLKLYKNLNRTKNFYIIE